MELNERTLEQILTRQREEYQRHIGVLTENVRLDVRLIAEGQVGLQEQLTAQREEFQRHLDELRHDFKQYLEELTYEPTLN